MILDVGIGETPLGTINLDVVPNPLCDIMGDVQYLPFRDDSIPEVVCMAVLEHVDNPYLALSELKRILTITGVVKIGVPMKKFTNNSLYYLIFFILNFPLTIMPKYIRLISRKIRQINNRDVALYHKYIITKNNISKYFDIEKVVEYGDILYFFLNCGRKSRYFKNKPKIDTAYLFTCRKRMIP